MVGLNQLCIDVGASIRDAISAIDRGSARCAFVLDFDGRLVGLVTDGDVRRGLLSGFDMNDPVERLMSQDFHVVRDRDAGYVQIAQRLIRDHDILQVPVVDELGRPVRLVTHADLEDDEVLGNWAVVMAGGMGTRLRPDTQHLPKPMVNVGDRPLLEHIVLHLKKSGLRTIFISVGYLADVIEEYFNDGSDWGLKIEYLREQRPLGTAGSLGLLPGKPERDILVMNGDVLSDVDLRSFLNHHTKANAAATVGSRIEEVSLPFGVLKCEQSKVIGIDEKPTFTYQANAGIYSLSPDVLKYVNGVERKEFTDLLCEMVEDGLTVQAFPIHEYWRDVGDKESLSLARRERQ